MILTLLAVSLNDQALTRPISARFDAQGGTIGRADHSTMALPDPERVISRKQAEVVSMAEGFMIRNLGAANPISVAGRLLAQGETATLRDADEIRIGGYLLRAEIGPQRPGTPAPPPADLLRTPTRPGSRVVEPAAYVSAPAPALSSTNPFAGLVGGQASGTFDDLLGPALQASAPATDPFQGMMAAPAGLGNRSTAVASSATPSAARLPDDFDLFAAPVPAPQPPRSPAPAPSDDPFAELMAAPRAESIDAAFGLGGGALGDDPLARFSAGLGANEPSNAGLSTDPLALFGEPAGPPPKAAPAQRDDLPAIHTPYRPPRVQSVVPTLPTVPPVPTVPTVPMVPATVPLPREPAPRATAPKRPAPLPADDAVGVGDAALWQAFCEGAGVKLPLPGARGPERMRVIGSILRSAVDGTMQLMAVRASTKHEMRAAITQIQARSNNPLKFAPDPGAGVEQLVQTTTRGFLDGPAAMDDAMQDLVGHSIGTVSGMRAAIEGMLDRFDPAALEKKLAGGSVLDALLPINRKARLWELYLQHHRSIHEEAQEDFHTLFGKAFVAAYEQQVQRLKQRGRS